MFSKHFLLFVALAVFVIVAAVQAKEIEVEDRSKVSFLNKGVEFLGKAFAKAAGHCLKDAALSCESLFKHFDKFLNCGGKYLYNHPGCLLS